MGCFDRDRMSNRFIVEIILRHKQSIIDSELGRKSVQDDINTILYGFIQKTGRKIENVGVEKVGDRYKLVLEIK